MTLAIYCAGGLGKEILELAKAINRWENIIFVDDVKDTAEHQGIPVLRFKDAAAYGTDLEFVIASGEPDGRKNLYEKIKTAGYSMATMVSPWTTVYPGATIGEGCILWDCGISADVEIGANTLISSQVIVGHDTVIGAHSIVSAKCFVGGNVRIDESVYLAPGVLVKDRIHISSGAIVSLGAVILRNVRPGAIMIGNPARRLGENTQNQVFNMFN